MNKLNKDEEKLKRSLIISVFVTIPFVLAIPPIFGWYIGTWLDEKLGTGPYLMFLFIFLGLIAGFRECYRIVKKVGNGF